MASVDIVYYIYLQYFLGLLYEIRERAPSDLNPRSKEVKSKEKEVKIKKKGKDKEETKQQFIVKLVAGEKEELLVYFSLLDYYIIGFGIPGKKNYVFQDFVGQIRDAKPLPFKSGYGEMGDLRKVSIGYQDFVKAVTSLIEQMNMNDDTKCKGWGLDMMTIVVFLAEAARFDIIGRDIHKNSISMSSKQEYSRDMEYNPARVGCFQTTQERMKLLMTTESYMHTEGGLPVVFDRYIGNWSNMSDVVRTYVKECEENGKIPDKYYLTTEEDDTLCMINMNPLEYNEKEYIEKVIKKKPELCYFMLHILCKVKEGEQDMKKMKELCIS